MVICLERGADLHMAQLMLLPLTVACSTKIQIGFTFLVPAHLGSPGKRALKRVCVCIEPLPCLFRLRCQEESEERGSSYDASASARRPHERLVFKNGECNVTRANIKRRPQRQTRRTGEVTWRNCRHGRRLHFCNVTREPTSRSVVSDTCPAGKCRTEK